LSADIGLIDAIRSLVRGAPSLQRVHDQIVADFEDPGPYVIFGGFARHVAFLLRNGATEEAREVLGAMEKLAAEGDLKTQELVQIGFWENLGDDREILSEARRLMGPATERLSHGVERWHGREES